MKLFNVTPFILRSFWYYIWLFKRALFPNNNGRLVLRVGRLTRYN
jgi:hypothetical protein